MPPLAVTPENDSPTNLYYEIPFNAYTVKLTSTCCGTDVDFLDKAGRTIVRYNDQKLPGGVQIETWLDSLDDPKPDAAQSARTVWDNLFVRILDRLLIGVEERLPGVCFSGDLPEDDPNVQMLRAEIQKAVRTTERIIGMAYRAD